MLLAVLFDESPSVKVHTLSPARVQELSHSHLDRAARNRSRGDDYIRGAGATWRKPRYRLLQWRAQSASGSAVSFILAAQLPDRH
jgi:hypothetical protein